MLNHSHSFRDFTSLSRILPATIAVCEHPFETPDATLHPEERALFTVRQMPPARRKEFAIGRGCAHHAMAQFGRGNEPVLIDTNRAPLWPDGLIGSITHCEGYSAAAVGRRNGVISLGIDAEIWSEFPVDIVDHIASPEEVAQSSLAAFDSRLSLALIFSAKESIYKAAHPLVRLFFDFRSVEVEFSVPDMSYIITSATIPEIANLAGVIYGRFLFDEEKVITSSIVCVY